MLLGSAMAVPKPLLHVPYAYIMAVTFSLPVASLFGVISLGCFLHFDGVTRTHCKVPNVVPSISAVVGGYTPERYIWRLGMAFFSFPRVFDAFLYYNFFSLCPLASSKGWYRWLNRLSWFLHVWQYMSLFQLTYISSTENFTMHRNGFIGFVVCSTLHMVAFLVLFRAGREPMSQRDKLSFRLRIYFAASHYLLFFISIYFYWRHNTFCEPYMYSWYSLAEYLVVLTNVAFHTVMAVDLGNDYYITVAPPSRVRHQD